ncbi:MAG: hypothetical protein ACXVZV_08385 [Terriglobales bacterium]
MQFAILFHKLMLFAIAASLVALAFRQLVTPQTVRAQSDATCGIYFEPGTTMVRTPGIDKQVIGKVAINTCNGQVWGFPTTVAEPYPVDTANPQPPVSHPIYLGQFDLAPVRT